MDTETKQRLKAEIIERMDLSGEIRDEDVCRLIDECIVMESAKLYIPLKEKVELKNELFNSIRKLDVLSELMDEEDITEIMINGPDKLFYEKDGRLSRSDKYFENEERLMVVIQQIVGEANRMVKEDFPTPPFSLKKVRIIIGSGIGWSVFLAVLSPLLRLRRVSLRGS